MVYRRGAIGVGFFDLSDETQNAVEVMRHFLEFITFETQLAQRSNLLHFDYAQRRHFGQAQLSSIR